MNSFKKLLVFNLLLISITINAQSDAFKVDIKGTGSPVLLFPGFTCPGDVWTEVVNELSKNHECHVFTFAGFGDVPAIDKPWLPKIKEAISAYISDKNLKKPTIIGHSLGGTIGLWLASENQNNIEKIIVVDALASNGALMIPNFKAEEISYDNAYNQQLLNMDDVNFKAMAKQMAKAMTLNTEKQGLISKWMIESDRKTYVYGYTDLLKLDLRKDISKIEIPVTILAATEPYGLETVKQTYAEQYKNLKNYNIKFAEGSAHFIMFDTPNWLIETIISEL